MSACPQSANCTFFITVESSVLKRIKFASAYPYCKGGQHEDCAIYPFVTSQRPFEPDLLPNGTNADYADVAPVHHHTTVRRMLVIDDSPVFMRIAANVVRNTHPHVEVVECGTYEDAREALLDGDVSLIVSGYGIGGGRNVRELRMLTGAPIVVLTGRPEDEIDAPVNSRVVQKDAGPGALTTAIQSFAIAQ